MNLFPLCIDIMQLLNADVKYWVTDLHKKYRNPRFLLSKITNSAFFKRVCLQLLLFPLHSAVKPKFCFLKQILPDMAFWGAFTALWNSQISECINYPGTCTSLQMYDFVII